MIAATAPVTPKARQHSAGGRFATLCEVEIEDALLTAKRETIMKHIVAKAGGNTDTCRDYEYTDWNDLRQFAADFGLRLSGGATRAAVH